MSLVAKIDRSWAELYGHLHHKVSDTDLLTRLKDWLHFSVSEISPGTMDCVQSSGSLQHFLRAPANDFPITAQAIAKLAQTAGQPVADADESYMNLVINALHNLIVYRYDLCRQHPQTYRELWFDESTKRVIIVCDNCQTMQLLTGEPVDAVQIHPASKSELAAANLYDYSHNPDSFSAAVFPV